ncbi:2-C-methyl-D-erythritol 4-phosphate cytidylyltransferase [Nocardioides mesophilus]|uniref:2-C-methyl-D-erythritol 4-phosphate cytidylyltransferase n=1 Tax=Nocardioides mesophilus TaxID=433659 RepID=A0A7G9RE50_9ACTN|nr:2-C-methyl-D-erythritol 4-phosphate cytidylyltransferase [Nocardioides mesophilus]QNN53875.1 2-C-methyl-D-erythritol 4-phosphate cytidylyltransferase [Nocardioides mesophilus]
MSDPELHGASLSCVGVVPLEGRGALPFVALHGEPLFLHAVRTLLATPSVRDVVVTADPDTVAEAEQELAAAQLPVEVLEAAGWWQAWDRSPSVPPRVALVDPLCPLVPCAFVARVLSEVTTDTAVAGYRPVTDTVKTVVDDQIVGTLDRDRLAVVASPVVVPGRLAGRGAPPVHDFALLADWLRERTELHLVRAPSMARRVGDESALRVLECLDELGRSVHEA